ncbi:MAG: hypothetical protein J5760_01455, partial [Clostridia bacterium]|nr:hypothetical protein [Clostridia bacterium]
MKLLEFDTRKTKPKLYNLIALTAVAAAVVTALSVSDYLKNAGAVCVTVAVYCFCAAIILFYSFREQIRYNLYSYNTILYFGFALFALFVMIAHIVLAVRVFRSPEYYDAGTIIGSLLSSAKDYIIISLPFLLVFSAAMCVSNFSLLRHEGRSFVNLLGIILSLLVTSGGIFIFVFDFYASGSQTEVMVHDLITNVFAAIYLYCECMLLGTIVADSIAAKHEPSLDRDYIIILGCGLNKEGAPTPLLRGRIERALAFAEKQKAANGK